MALLSPASAAAAAYPDGDGHTVRVEAPNLPPDPARDQAFADFLGSLLHSFEMDGITVHLAATQQEIDQACGGSPFACLNGFTLTVPGWLPASDFDQQVAIAHEYGHVIHSARPNPPRGSGSDGTKRWATHEGICQGLRAGIYGTSYENMPREGFAHAYATLNLPSAPWFFVESLRPDATALEAIREDVLVPWQPTKEKLSGTLTRSRKRIVHELALPLDGVLSARLKTKGRLRAKMKLIANDRRPRGRAFDYEICGERSVRIKVTAKQRTRGRFKVRIERP